MSNDWFNYIEDKPIDLTKDAVIIGKQYFYTSGPGTSNHGKVKITGINISHIDDKAHIDDDMKILEDELATKKLYHLKKGGKSRRNRKSKKGKKSRKARKSRRKSNRRRGRR